MRRVGIMLMIVVAAAAVAGAARGDGGTTIANAPELTPGETVTGTVTNVGSRVQFWRLTVKPGDQVTINFAALSTVATSTVGLCFLLPTVDDFTLQDSRCLEPLETDHTNANTKRQTTRVFASGGRWTLIVGNYSCMNGGRPLIPCFYYSTQYELTAYVRSATRTTLTANPNLVKAGGTVTAKGKVTGVTSGNVAIQVRQSGWKTVKIAKIGAGGTFVAKIKAPAKGKLTVRAVFPGDSSHLPSKAAATPIAVV